MRFFFPSKSAMAPIIGERMATIIIEIEVARPQYPVARFSVMPD